MGVPTTGFVSMYRNPLWQVQRFFNKRHPGAYRIFNVCPELPYDHAKFDNNVVAFDVQDHTPPTMDILMEFLINAKDFMSEGLKDIPSDSMPGAAHTVIACYGTVVRIV